MTRIRAPLFVVAALSIALAGCVVGHTPSAANAAPLSGQTSAPPSFDVAMPAPQAPFDTTPITAVETVGASRTE
jgi:hypothetical protein